MQLEGSEFELKLRGKEATDPTGLIVELCRVINMQSRLVSSPDSIYLEFRQKLCKQIRATAFSVVPQARCCKKYNIYLNE